MNRSQYSRIARQVVAWSVAATLLLALAWPDLERPSGLKTGQSRVWAADSASSPTPSSSQCSKRELKKLHSFRRAMESKKTGPRKWASFEGWSRSLETESPACLKGEPGEWISAAWASGLSKSYGAFLKFMGKAEPEAVKNALARMKRALENEDRSIEPARWKQIRENARKRCPEVVWSVCRPRRAGKQPKPAVSPQAE